MAVIMATVFPLLQLRLCQHLNYKPLFSGVYILAINICREMKIGMHCPKAIFLITKLGENQTGFFYTARGKRIGDLLRVVRCISMCIYGCIHRGGGQVYSQNVKSSLYFLIKFCWALRDSLVCFKCICVRVLKPK